MKESVEKGTEEYILFCVFMWGGFNVCRQCTLLYMHESPRHLLLPLRTREKELLHCVEGV